MDTVKYGIFLKANIACSVMGEVNERLKKNINQIIDLSSSRMDKGFYDDHLISIRLLKNVSLRRL